MLVLEKRNRRKELLNEGFSHEIACFIVNKGFKNVRIFSN